jgi:hypothetical protein
MTKYRWNLPLGSFIPTVYNFLLYRLDLPLIAGTLGTLPPKRFKYKFYFLL